MTKNYYKSDGTEETGRRIIMALEAEGGKNKDRVGGIYAGWCYYLDKNRVISYEPHENHLIDNGCTFAELTTTPPKKPHIYYNGNPKKIKQIMDALIELGANNSNVHHYTIGAEAYERHWGRIGYVFTIDPTNDDIIMVPKNDVAWKFIEQCYELKTI